MTVTLALASANPGKLRELAEIFDPTRFELVPASQFPGWKSPPETGNTYLANALIKARSLMEHSGVPSIADDSGIEADALGGRPGVRSARFAGPDASDDDNLEALLLALQDVGDEHRRGRYRCLAVCVHPDGREWTAEATWEGTIVREPRGRGGFGYDPIFLPDGSRRTAAELTADQKRALSHRGKAFRDLVRQLEAALG